MSGELFITEAELLRLLEERRGDRSIRAFSVEVGIGFQGLARVLKGQDGPGIAIPAYLGFEPVTLYRPIKRRGKR